MIDSHVHLDHPSFEADFEDVLAHAVEDGVSALVNIGFDRTSARATKSYVDSFPFIYGVVGTHPHDAAAHDDDFQSELTELLDHPRILGVGEIGLDFYYDHSPRDVQARVFRRMLRLARRKQKPVVIHCRDAGGQVLEILSSEGTGLGGIFHAFSGDAEMARRVLDLGFYLGIGGVATFKKSRLQELIGSLPLDRLVLETDSPYLSPQPFRGRRNEPGFVRFVAAEVARAHGVSADDVIRKTADNFFAALDVEPKTPPPPVYSIGGNVYIHTVEGAAPAWLGAAVSGAVGGKEIEGEAVVCGYADLLANADQVKTAAVEMKKRGVPVRLVVGVRGYTTRGRGPLAALRTAIDAVTVRLYGATAAQHEKVAATGLGAAAFDSLVECVRNSVAAGIRTECQFVAVPKTKLEPCRSLADSLGAEFSIRKYGTL